MLLKRFWVIRPGLYTLPQSALFWKVDKVFYVGEKHIKLKMLVFYKSNRNICQWLNPTLRSKKFKVIKEIAESWEKYEK